ncbi:enoyl-[acyl-carrier-protein] reductase [NADPH] FabL-like [Glandiceps talaboti]
MESERKVAIVTGGTRGIGFGIAKTLARDGYDLVLGFNANEERAKESQSHLEEKFGAKVVTVKGDVGEEDTVTRLFEAVEERFNGILHVLVHNAGLFVDINRTSTTPTSESAQLAAGENGNGLIGSFAQMDYYQRVYPKCLVRCVEKGLPYMEKAGEGHIVTISSPGCNATQPPRLMYLNPGQAKTVVEYLTRYYALQLAPSRINVNCLIPGFTKTEVWGNMALEMLAGKYSPMGEVITPEDIGEAAAFLCKPSSRFITGQIISVDGALSLRAGPH